MQEFIKIVHKYLILLKGSMEGGKTCGFILYPLFILYIFIL